MLFIQKHSITEYKFGQQTVWFAVSDNYSELYTDIGIETNIFTLDTVKQDLNTDEGSFAIDELSFSINQLSCSNDNDKKALFFCLDATDLKINRYCAVFFGDAPTLENLLFIGKIDTKVSGDDKVWGCGNYPVNINPKREYKFSALSFDVSILERCKHTDTIEDDEGTLISNIYDRLSLNDYTEIKAIFEDRIAYRYNPVFDEKIYIRYLGNLHKVLKLYMDKAEDILFELLNVNLTFNILESDIGIKSNPTLYKLASGGDPSIPENIENNSNIELIGVAIDKILKIKLSNTDNGSDWSSPFISRKLVDSTFGIGDSSDNYYKNASNVEQTYSFKKLDNISELLFEIARAFACYVFFTYTTGTEFNIEFKPREGLIETDFTYLVGAIDASIDTSSIVSEESNTYYGISNNYLVDGINDMYIDRNSEVLNPSEQYNNNNESRKEDEEKRNIKSGRLMLTTSQSFIVDVEYSKVYNIDSTIYRRYPLNAHNATGIWGSDFRITAVKEFLTSALYLKTTPSIHEPKQIERLGADFPIWRPAVNVLTKINGKNETFKTLTEYVNVVMSRDKHYYETEYSLTVPYWNGFSKNPNSSGANWKNLKLGSKFKLSEPVTRYINNQWVEQIVERDYIVVSIERSLSKPETKLKLHSLERFAFGYWDGATSDIPGIVFKPLVNTDAETSNTIIEEYPYDISETINAGDAVSLMPNGKLVKTQSIAEHYYCIGIALTNSEGETTIKTQIGGRVQSNNYTFTNIGGYCFARTVASGCNITQNGITDSEIGGAENAIIVLGTIDSDNSFILNIDSMVIG